jgi:hypothetical protein
VHLDIVAAGILALDFPDIPFPLVLDLFEIDDATVEGHLPDLLDADALGNGGAGNETKGGTGRKAEDNFQDTH